MATIDITITYPDGKVVDLRDTLAAAKGYQAFLDEEQTIPNPETKSQFVLRTIKEHTQEWIRNTYKAQKAREAEASAPSGDSLGLT
jgi:hypothetical protein